MTARLDEKSALQDLLSYPLIEALVHRRSRRFSLGASIPGGGLEYASKHAPVPLTIQEEALLAFAAAGINGFALGDLPFDQGKLHEGGGGNVIATLTGRTIASADAVHATALFVINDDGTYLLKRPQDFTIDEIGKLGQMAVNHQFDAMYEQMRIPIRDARTTIKREVPYVFPFNKWSTNLPGSTYFLPVCDLTGMYINVILSCFDEQMALFLVDDRNGLKPAGIKQFGKSKGGRLHDNADDNRVVPIARLESVIVEFMLAEQAFMVHNLSLMEQAMGLGGWTHFATATDTGWFEALGFRLGSQRVTQGIRAGLFHRIFLRLLGQDRAYPFALGLTVDGADLIKPFCPPYYKNMKEAVLAFVEFKKANVVRASVKPGYEGTWKQPSEIQSTIPEFSDACIDATIAYCTYLHDSYGRFPANFAPLRTTLAHQAHHLDLDFYDTFYKPGAYTETQRRHLDHWH
jgi:hypothetical protein